MLQPALLKIEDSGAKFSDDRKYRYTLWREWDKSKGTAVFIGLNPSTADETEDDPTVIRCINYAKMWGYGKMYMLNIFGFRATDPKVMKAEEWPVGLRNDKHLVDICSKVDLVVCAWGVNGKHRGRGDQVATLLECWDIPMTCLTVTKAGHPGHPLYLSGQLKPQLFDGYQEGS